MKVAAFLVASLASCASGQWYNFLSGAVDSLFKPIFEGPPPSFQEWQQQKFQEHVQVELFRRVSGRLRTGVKGINSYGLCGMRMGYM